MGKLKGSKMKLAISMKDFRKKCMNKKVCVKRVRSNKSEQRKLRPFLCSDWSSLRLQLEAHADFVSAGVEVLPVDQSREGDLYACAHTANARSEESTALQANLSLLRPKRAYTGQGMRVLEAGAYLAEGSGCSLLQSDWRCSLWPVTVRENQHTCFAAAFRDNSSETRQQGHLQTETRLCPAGIWQRCQSGCCYCRRSRPESPPSPAGR